MTQNLARYHARAPRYILDTQDDELIRVAGPRQVPWEEGTEIRNVSLTGLAFTASEDLCPLLGEVIKIQFMVPGGKQMACHGVVTRLDPDRGDKILVGVHFYKLEMSHRIVLAQGLSQKFKASVRNQEVELDSKPHVIIGQVFMMSLLLSLWSWLMLSLIEIGYNGYISLIAKYFR